MSNREFVTFECIEPEEDGAGRMPGVSLYPTGLEGHSPEGRVTAHSHTKSGHKMIVRQQEGVDYVGTTVKAPSETDFMPCRFVLGVFNKKKGKVSVMPIFGDRIFRMEPKLHGLDYGKSDLVTDFGEGHQGSWLSRKRVLQEFGHAKIKKRIKDRESTRIVAGTLQSADALKKVVEDARKEAEASGLTRDQLNSGDEQRKSLPPHHPEATTGREAYQLHEICPPAFWQYLPTTELLNASKDPLAEANLRNTKGFSMFVLDHLPKLNEGTEKEIDMKAICLSFISSMCFANKIPRQLEVATEGDGMKKLAQKYKIKAVAMIDFILQRFYTSMPSNSGRSYQQPDTKRRLLQQYVLVMALHMDDFYLKSTNVEKLRLDLGLNTATIKKLLNLLGCSIIQARVGGASQFSAELLTKVTNPPKTLQNCFPVATINLRNPRRQRG